MKALKPLKDRIERSQVAHFCYKGKFYIDVAVGQVSWATAKFPEIMALHYLLSLFGIAPSRGTFAFLIVFGVLSLLAFGYFLKHTGLYDVDVYVTAHKNPVQDELLQAARIIQKAQKEGRL